LENFIDKSEINFTNEEIRGTIEEIDPIKEENVEDEEIVHKMNKVSLFTDEIGDVDEVETENNKISLRLSRTDLFLPEQIKELDEEDREL